MPVTSTKPHRSPEIIKIGHRIAEYREAKGLTQSDFSKLLGTSQSAVARMEKGEQNLSTNMLVRIGEILDAEMITIPSDALNFKIHGGRKLSGSVTTNTSKNSAVVMLCAALLNRGTTVLKKMPRIEEVNRVIEVLESIGVDVKWKGNDVVITPPRQLQMQSMNTTAAMKTRSVLLLLGPLVHLLKEFTLPQPGGCKLGARTVRPHLFALENFGVSIVTHRGRYNVTARRLHAADVVLYEAGDTVTENALMAAAKTKGVTTIKFASANYQVQDLCVFLQALGVRIEGIGTTTLRVWGKPTINKRVTYQISEDPIESMLFITAAAVTRSSITIERCPIDFLEMELLKLEKMGFKYARSAPYKAANGHTELVDITTHASKFVALEEAIHAGPYPALNMDNLPFFVPIATQARGQTLIHDWTYENRAIYYMELTKLNAELILADPHRVYVNGPTRLRPAEIICPPALRPAAVILISMLAAEGTSILRNVYSINRGYEDLYARLNRLGAKIEVLKDF
ncbi:MAG TPA: UDP-N-acetylglucosamine 1-carboxyvinyltransferase [Candidatus Saccharimonadales bacterium]|nr:UDP-N-acetylglucosamine 1-carboxyvinyltransferase [Candidatus Saccharimonadales bacterium]